MCARAVLDCSCTKASAIPPHPSAHLSRGCQGTFSSWRAVDVAAGWGGMQPLPCSSWRFRAASAAVMLLPKRV